MHQLSFLERLISTWHEHFPDVSFPPLVRILKLFFGSSWPYFYYPSTQLLNHPPFLSTRVLVNLEQHKGITVILSSNNILLCGQCSLSHSCFLARACIPDNWPFYVIWKQRPKREPETKSSNWHMSITILTNLMTSMGLTGITFSFRRLEIKN